MSTPIGPMCRRGGCIYISAGISGPAMGKGTAGEAGGRGGGGRTGSNVKRKQHQPRTKETDDIFFS